MNKRNVVFNDDQKAVLLKALKDLHFANGQLHECVSKDALTEEMAATLPSLIESHFCEIAKMLNYESHLRAEEEKRYEEIKHANQKIRELETKLGSNRGIDGLPEQLKYLREKVSNWWATEGFNHISGEKFTPYGGLELQFCFMLDSSRIFSKSPVSDKKQLQEHMDQLRTQGFEFADNETDRMYQKQLIDNEKNRKLLITLLKKRFPSLEVYRIDNRSSSDTDDFLIWHVEATIYELSDI